MSRMPKPPIVTPDGQMLQAMGAKHMQQIVLSVFQTCGGEERLAHEANKDFKWFAEQFLTRTMPKNVSTEHSVNLESADALFKRLAERRRAREDAAFLEARDITPQD